MPPPKTKQTKKKRFLRDLTSTPQSGTRSRLFNTTMRSQTVDGGLSNNDGSFGFDLRLDESDVGVDAGPEPLSLVWEIDSVGRIV